MPMDLSAAVRSVTVFSLLHFKINRTSGNGPDYTRTISPHFFLRRLFPILPVP